MFKNDEGEGPNDSLGAGLKADSAVGISFFFVSKDPKLNKLGPPGPFAS